MLLTATLSLLLMQQSPAENVDWDAEFGVEEVERDPATGEIPVEPYEQKNENAGAKPFTGDDMAETFGGRDGIRRRGRGFWGRTRLHPRQSQLRDRAGRGWRTDRGLVG